jgi:hypothetical protein
MRASGRRDCPSCAEPVQKAALLCPHCRSKLPNHKYLKPKRSGKFGAVLCWFIVGFLGMYAWQAFERGSDPAGSVGASRTEISTSRASPETGYCTKAQHEDDRVTMAFAFASGLLQNVPKSLGPSVRVDDAYWARMNYRAKVGFMRSLECAIAGPGKALANTGVRSQRSGRLLATWEAGKLNAP